jgi:tetratricopeptide (TPR) repeat protein
MILAIIIVSFSCQTRTGDDHMILTDTFYHRKYGKINVYFLPESVTLKGYPCKRGKVRMYDNDQLMWLTLSGDHRINNDLIPAGSKVTLSRDGKPLFIQLSKDTEIKGIQVSGKKQLSYWFISFYEDGSLRRFRSVSDVEIDGIPCSYKKEIELYPDGHLLTCYLSGNYKTEHESFPAGKQLFIDETGKAQLYSEKLYNITGSRIMDKFAFEPVEKVYKIRMSGKIDPAGFEAIKLNAFYPGSPLICYEQARIERQRYISGGGMPFGFILKNSGKAADMDPQNVKYVFFDADCALFAADAIKVLGNREQATTYYTRAINGYERVLELKPDYHAARLTLIDIYTHLPADGTGYREKAEKHTQDFREFDPVWAARAEALLLPDDSSRVSFWLNFKESFRADPQVMQELGRACLYTGDIRKATECFRQAIEMDTCKKILLLSLAQYHLEKARKDSLLAEEHNKAAEAFFREFLDTEPVQPVQAWCLWNLGELRKLRGNVYGIEGMTVTPESTGRRFSNTIPPMILYIPPGELYEEYRNYFGPY